MAQGTYTTELDDIDVDDADLEAEEGVEVDGDVDAWMTEMLSSPSSSYDY
jgi:hypothetical protein